MGGKSNSFLLLTKEIISFVKKKQLSIETRETQMFEEPVRLRVVFNNGKGR